MKDFDLEQTDRLLTTTRAVRKRLDLTRPVPRELILDCIRVATQAPAGGNVQRWRWVVVDDPDLKRGVADLYRKAYRPYMAAQRDAVEKSGRGGMEAIMSSSDHLAEVLHEVPALGIVDDGAGSLGRHADHMVIEAFASGNLDVGEGQVDPRTLIDQPFTVHRPLHRDFHPLK